MKPVKTNREKGPALVGIELERPEDFEPLVGRMKSRVSSEST